MSLLVGTNLGKSYAALDVFDAVDVRIEDGDRIGFVGPNGTGKTTLLRILAGVEARTTGELARKRGLTIGYLPQDPPPAGEVTLHEAMLCVFAGLLRQGAALAELEHQLAEAASRQSEDYAALLEAYGHAQTAFEVAGGYAYETRIRQVLGGLGFNEDEHGKLLAHLSGGERTRALLAQLLLEEPDLLLMDEPTNHLDLEAVEWLEETLTHWRGALVVVAHDRYFLDKIATRIWEMDFGRLEAYRGNYSAYHLQAEMRQERLRREWEAQQEFVEKTEDFIRRNLAGQHTREAQGRRTRLERFQRDDAIERPREDRHIRLGLTTHIRSGDLVLATKDLVVGYDQPLFNCPDAEIRRGDRVALIGPNGAGKTTLLKTILGQMPPLAGKVRFGASVQVGYLAQAQAGLNPDQSVLDAILEIKDLSLTQARSYLGQFLFVGDDVFRSIGILSGGQRSRVALARLTLQGANLLLLDEPTNHLDLPSQEILEGVLKRFPGTILLVSHDRYLVQALVTYIWRVGGSELRVYKGNYDEYLRQRAAEAAGGVVSPDRGPTPDPRGLDRAQSVLGDLEGLSADAPSAGVRHPTAEPTCRAAGRPHAVAPLHSGRRPSTALHSAQDASTGQREASREQIREERRQRKVAERLAEQTVALEVQIHGFEAQLTTLSTQLEAASLAGDVGKVRSLGMAYQSTDAELQRLMAEWAQLSDG